MVIPDTDKPAEPNMTPMIDVVFQLLIFFLLSMSFPEVEGSLKLQMPRDKGPANRPAPPRMELRILICAGGDTASHVHRKEIHDRAAKDGRECRVLVEKLDAGSVAATALDPAAGPRNAEIYRRAAALAREIAEAGPNVDLIVDADAETPYEHVLGVTDALMAAGLRNVEFTASTRFPRPPPGR